MWNHDVRVTFGFYWLILALKAFLHFICPFWYDIMMQNQYMGLTSNSILWWSSTFKIVDVLGKFCSVKHVWTSSLNNNAQILVLVYSMYFSIDLLWTWSSCEYFYTKISLLIALIDVCWRSLCIGDWTALQGFQNCFWAQT